MKHRIALISAAIAILGGLAPLSPVFGATLRVGGTGAVSQLLRQMAPAFKAETGIALDVVPSLGTSGANKAVADGVLGVAVAGRDLTAIERAKGLTVTATLRTPFGLATSRSGPDDLKSADIATLYRAAKPLWPDGTPILIFLRPVDESDNIVLGHLFPGMDQAIAQARKRSDLSVAATDQDNADVAEKTSGSLIGATLTQVVTEKRDLRFVSIDGIAANLGNYENGSYRHGKTFFVVVPSAVGPEAAAFVAFLGRPKGQSLLREAGIVAGDK